MNYAIRANGINVVVHKPVMPEHDKGPRPVMSEELRLCSSWIWGLGAPGVSWLPLHGRY